METLSLNELELIEGGSFMAGFCGVLGTAGAIAYYAGATAVTGGAAGVVLGVAVGACAVYGIYSIFS